MKTEPKKPNAFGSVYRCSKCNEAKTIDDFYLKRGKPESFCKECKKAKRKHHNVEKSAPSVLDETIADECQQNSPTGKPHENGSYIEPRKELSFDLWERKYGRPLTEEERFEIKYNLTNFFKLLLKGSACA